MLEIIQLVWTSGHWPFYHLLRLKSPAVAFIWSQHTVVRQDRRAVHSTCGDMVPVCRRSVRAATHGWSACSLHKGHPLWSERDLIPGSHSARPAVCPGAGLCLPGGRASFPHSHRSAARASRVSGEQEVFTGERLEQGPEVSL